MSLPAVTPEAPKGFNWKRLFIIAAATAATLVAIYIAAVEYLSSPKAWDRKSITAEYEGLTIQRFGPSSDASMDCSYNYRIHNSNKYSYTLSQPPIGQLMAKPQDGKEPTVLKDATWPPGITVPAKQTVSATFTFSYRLADFNVTEAQLNDDKKLAEFIDSRLKSVRSLAFVDYGYSIEIDLPFRAGSGSNKK
jgi:hypothetical protein